ncbi:heterodimeric geranylgeranyl pyrophosphate synthase small subunit, chloroplastic-like [Rhodamnia argentea]|uniref:Heterodimeric geranylgeranyl pyrophosphate synthase small subunit, chloroplastic-like n=1 Tax=Rhodamnia argentea TaxID=178133 RepID=A0A8B8Q740_9MYRT|nr:heterodimeric geranylgeranyl pyrophosphate synthase small subunit, chloroplastic-like [Rhodamnia argentea]
MEKALLGSNGRAATLFNVSPKPHPGRPPSARMPIAMAVPKSGTRSTSQREAIYTEIEDHLRKAIPKPPPVVFEPMHHLTFAVPQGTAPALCIAACELVGGGRDQAMPAAAALHIIHAAAFAHENLPLTDRPEIRPPVAHAYRPNVELMTGDGMVPFGFELLAGSDDPAGENSERILRAIVEITRAAGSQGMVSGQYHEVEYLLPSGRGRREPEWADHVWAKKEGELHACAAACGAILGGGAEEEIEGLRRYGFYVGMIRGMMARGDGRREDGGVLSTVRDMKKLALKALEGFDQGKVEAVASILDANMC